VEEDASDKILVNIPSSTPSTLATVDDNLVLPSIVSIFYFRHGLQAVPCMTPTGYTRLNFLPSNYNCAHWVSILSNKFLIELNERVQ
jgi:hypothetical protein